MNHTERRNHLRAILAGSKCLSPAAVYDPLSARIAESVGYKIGILPGSLASHTTLAAPDGTGVLTLTEFADQARRITRASTLSLIADTDNGYGNALNVMRTVQELEHAGVSMICIEDTVLPRPFGRPQGVDELVSVAEMVGKLRAAIAARNDPALIIVGRTSGLRVEDTQRTVARVKAYAASGVDAILLAGLVAGLKNIQQIEAVHVAAQLPIVLGGGAPASFTREDLAARGVRIQLQGHQAVAAAAKALRQTYTHLYNGGVPADLESKFASPQEMAALVDGENYTKWQCEYLS